MGFQKNDERMNAGGNGGGGYISKPGEYVLRIVDAEEAYSAGRAQLKLTCEDVDGAGRVRGRFDTDGAFAWRTDRLCDALGINGYDHPGDLLGMAFTADVRFQRGSDKYMEIGRVSAPPTPNRMPAPVTNVPDDEPMF